MCSWVLSICKNGDFLDPLGILFQSLTALIVKTLFLYIQGNLEATFLCFLLPFCWALLWRVWLLWQKVMLCCCYTLSLDSWRQQSDTHTYILLLNAGQTLLSQLHLLHHMLQPLNYPHILAVFCWNLSSLLISSFLLEILFCIYLLVQCGWVSWISWLIPGVQCKDTWATGRHWPWTSRAISLEESASLLVMQIMLQSTINNYCLKQWTVEFHIIKEIRQLLLTSVWNILRPNVRYHVSWWYR